MSESITYMLDEHGEKVSAVVPMKEWKKIHKQNALLRKKIKVLTSLQSGLHEVAKIKQTGAELPTLSEFLHEYKS